MKNPVWRSFTCAGILASAAWAQQGAVVSLPPVPANPNEPITAGVQLLATPAERAAGLNLINLAGQNYSFWSVGASEVTLATTLQSSGPAKVEGSGTMVEIHTNQRTTWFSDFGGVRSGRPYPLASNPVPLRVEMARMALLWPIAGHPAAQQLRVAHAQLGGQPVTCVLVNAAAATSLPEGRSWLENEYCINAAGLMQLMSPKPGIYFLYDYSGAQSFAGHSVAGSVTVIEGTATVLRVQVTRVSAPTAEDLATLGQLAPGPADLSAPVFWNFHPRDRTHVTSVAVVHCTIGPDGTVQDAEAIPAGNATAEQQALNRLLGMGFPRARVQREIYAQFESN